MNFDHVQKPIWMCFYSHSIPQLILLLAVCTITILWSIDQQWGSKNWWPDQTWQVVKEEELNVIPSSANHWEQWQLGSTYYGFSWSSLLLSVIFFSDAVSGMSLSLWSWTLVERPLHLGGCCLMPCYSSSWSGWLVCKFVITYNDRNQNMVC